LKKKTFIWLVILLGIVLAALYAYKEYTRVNPDLSHVRPDVKIGYNELLDEYSANDSLANAKYLGKIIQTSGPLKEVEISGGGYYTLILGDNQGLSSIRCAIDTSHNETASQLKAGSTIMVRGECTGFKKNELLGENLGSDVELNRSVIILQNNK